MSITRDYHSKDKELTFDIEKIFMFMHIFPCMKPSGETRYQMQKYIALLKGIYISLTKTGNQKAGNTVNHDETEI
ncbi:MAG: hypothetical protein V1775_08605 [Bacteroidota bacterium]